SLYHEKVLELARKLSIYSNVVSSFQPLRLPDSDNADEIRASLRELEIRVANVNASGAPRVVPPTMASNEWATLMQAQLDLITSHLQRLPENPATMALTNLLKAYADGNVAEFNRRLADYRSVLQSYEEKVASNGRELQAAGVANAEILSQKKIDFE